MKREEETIRIPPIPVEDTRPLPEPARRSSSPQRHRSDQAARRAIEPPLASQPVLPKKIAKRRPPGCGCFLSLLLLLIIIGSAFAAYWFIAARQVPPPIDSLSVDRQYEEALRRGAHNIHFILVGDDERNPDEPARADTLIYTVLRPIDKKIAMVSIPRDSLVTIPGQGEDKINAALAYGEMPLLKETVESLVDAPVNHSVLVNFDSFQRIVDAIGGIEMTVPEKMYLPEENIDLEAGEQHLDGYQALAFVRWRGDGKGDLGRIERQRAFMQAVMDKSRHLMPWQALRLAYVLHKEVKTDLTPIESLNLIRRMAGTGGDALSFESFEHNPQYIDGISYVLLDDANVRSTINRMRYGVDIDALPH